ncbi:MAG TPA: class I SAM-dependent methyltransferase [Solirubrobacteraceae bacterium]|jgi:SAM-dependent methyltransferase|nr:class I SAM-dependent methyltransferase [Solirubrobacteraceae bacterium]
MTLQTTADPARNAYATFAAYYDRFTADYEYDGWLAQIDDRARALGVFGRRVLDVGCGTGKSFAPLLARGYEVTACDISPEMVEEARAKFGGEADEIFVADMRDLPAGGPFDLVTCIDDGINYLLTDEDLVAAFRGVADVLAPGGVYAFDVNSLKTYRTAFSQTFVREVPGAVFCWRGESGTSVAPGDASSATIEMFIAGDDDLWQRVTSRHFQRHHEPAAIRAALERAGLECAAVAGQWPGSRLDDVVDETQQIKLVYFARRAARVGGDAR